MFTNIALHFTTATQGWLAGGFTTSLDDQLFTTQDGGATWRPATLPTPPNVSALGRRIGAPIQLSAQTATLAVMYSLTLQTYTSHDAGATWTLGQTFTLPDAASPVLGAAGGNVWLLARDLLLISHDGGATWSVVAHTTDLSSARAITFGDALHGWLVVGKTTGNCKVGGCVSATTVLHTTDGGATWAATPLTLATTHP